MSLSSHIWQHVLTESSDARIITCTFSKKKKSHAGTHHAALESSRSLNKQNSFSSTMRGQSPISDVTATTRISARSWRVSGAIPVLTGQKSFPAAFLFLASASVASKSLSPWLSPANNKKGTKIKSKVNRKGTRSHGHICLQPFQNALVRLQTTCVS